jgi:glycerol-3-phosphate O-acyltransferase/dihydroxyacetone phosphate acyltransferase
MALGALAKGTPVTIVPVGLNYFSAHKFRSRAVIEFGDPVVVSASLIQAFKNGNKRGSVGGLMSQIHEALAAVTVSAPDFDTLMVCYILLPFRIDHG